MTRVLFIHGTMTRYDEDFVRTTSTIRERLQGWRADLVFEEFPWGEYWGAELNPRFATIPGYDEQTLGVLGGGSADSGDDAGDPAVALWALLYERPAAELQLMAAGAQLAPAAPQSDASAALARELHLFAAQAALPPLADVLVAGGIAATFPAALQWAITLFDAPDQQLRAALRTISDAQLSDYRSALARAIVAAAMAAARAGGAYPELFLDAEQRDQAVEALDQALGSETVLGGASDWLSFLPASALTGLVLRPYRFGLTKLALAFLGDIFAYQARRTRIQAEIAGRLGDEPTILLAHSLGGIACVDMLLSDPATRARVPLLITAGSQAGVLYEIGALGLLGAAGEAPAPLDAGFPPWLNLFDRNDMLGFRAAPVFAGTVRDVELNGRQPFPHAHNAYWRNHEAWEHIFAAIAAPGQVLYQLR